MGSIESFLSAASASSKQEQANRIAELLNGAGITPDVINRIDKVRISEWEGLTKDNDGNPELTKQSAVSVVLTPEWQGPEWPVVQQAKPTLVKVPSQPSPSAKRSKGYNTAVILPDPQIGFRRLSTGELDPFHDEQAMKTALALIDEVKPEVIVNLGDLLDFASFSARFVQEPGFSLTTQAALDRAHLFLAEQRARAPKAKIVLMEGNHDKRLPLAIMTNAAAAFGIRQANTPAAWPVMSVPHLLRLDDLKVEYVGGFPNGRYWLNDRLCCAHGPKKLRSAGSSAVASIDDERVSVITGHIHRIETVYKTRDVKDGYRTNFVASIGCLCRIDGATPSTKSSLDPHGNPVTAYENWQNGAAVATYRPGDGDFSLEIMPIFDNKAIFRGKRI